MAVQFILGRSGTGKTSYCIRSVCDELNRQDGRQLILLVPEQATYQVERAVLGDKKIAGYNRLNVLSFDRLQFLLSGKNTARPALSHIGRQMIIQRLLRENKSKLKIFDSLASASGLARQVAQSIEELHRYAKSPDDISRLLGDLAKDRRNNLTVLKFTDIALILEQYLKFIEADYLDPDVQLIRTCRQVASSSLAKNAKLWVDGFAGFTGIELEVLTELLKVVADGQIALCLDPKEIDLTNSEMDQIDPAGLFYPTQKTYAELYDRIKKCKLQLKSPVILKQAVRFNSCAQLAHIEHNIFEVKPSRLDSAGNIRIISAPNERAEVKYVARRIIELVGKKKYRYRDIAVIASDIDGYRHYIKAYFEDYEIPYFIDKRKPLNRHPVVQLVASALRTVTNGFSHSDIFACLKTDLVPMERYDIDLLENYCLAFGITGRDWQSDKQWNFADKDDENFDRQKIHRIRIEAVTPLLKLRDGLCPIGDTTKKIAADEFTKLIFAFIDELKVRQTIGTWIEQARENGESAVVEEHRQFYNGFVNIFDKLVEVFAGQTMTAGDFFEIINSAFSQLTLAFIPPTLDQVLVGSIERSRHPDLKAVYLIGATQKQFPVPLVSDRILTDDDRLAAESADFRLAPTLNQTLAERQYLAYIAFTRPSEFLCITCPSVDQKGQDVPRSRFIDNLESLFDNLNEKSIADESIEIEDICNEIELEDLLCTELGRDTYKFKARDSETLGELLEDICSDEKFKELGSNVLAAVDYDNSALLTSDVVGELFDRQMQSSATRLGTFAACPYQYFARYTLQLEQRKEFKFEPLDLGRFYHNFLDALLKNISEQKKDFVSIEDKELLKILRRQTEQVIQNNSFILNFSRHSPHNAYIISSAAEILEDFVLAVGQMIRAGSFRPALSEISFGLAGDTHQTLGKYVLRLPDGHVLSLNGKIDRLDIADIDGESTALVFDYKRSENGAKFGWSEFYYGLDMQLPLYMLAVRNASVSEIKKIAGAFYMPVEVSPKRAAPGGIPDKTDTFNYKAKGIFDGKYYRRLDSSVESGWSKFYSFGVSSKQQQYGHYGTSGVLKPDDFEKVLGYAEKKIIDLASRILSGQIDVRPYRLSGKSPCSYCKYGSVCRFDWQINDYEPLSSLGKERALEMMETVDG
ncbi:MAG: exodeoxyribonuclease V subunit gamma [Sedimentisphaerales bacterium]|nr:exodeoxyribonuclease V subunit gamma [Sedimentisphaerales bacterium]